jgi:uncharacterized protein (TIGR02996 family)
MSRAGHPSPLRIEPYFQKITGCEPFLRAIAEEPDDDMHRLIFADWLDEHGHSERAEFIRLQVVVARSPATTYQKEEAAKKLLLEHEKAWTAGLHHLLDTSPWRSKPGLGFSRGMLEVLPLTSFVELSPKDQERLDIRCVIIDAHRPKPLAALLQCDRLKQISTLRSAAEPKLNREMMRVLSEAGTLTKLVHLELNKTISPEGAAALAKLPLLRQLRSLCLGYTRMGDAVLLELLQSPLCPQLRRLELYHCHLTDVSAEAIAQSSKLTELTRLVLSSNLIRAAGGLALAISSTLGRLVYFNLAGNKLGAAARTALVEARAFPNLRFFYLDDHTLENDSGVGIKGTQALAKDASRLKPTHLDLQNAGVTPEAMRLLVESPGFETVRTINLQHALVRPETLAELVSSPRFAQITGLNLQLNKLKGKHLKPLLETPHAGRLEQLDLSWNDLNEKTAEALLTSPNLAGLKLVHLHSNQPLIALIEHSPRFAGRTGSTTPGKVVIKGNWPYRVDSAVARKLGASPLLAEFTELQLDGMWMKDEEGLAALMKSPYLANLTRLTLSHVGETAAAALVECPHLGKLEHLKITGFWGKEWRKSILKRWPFATVTTHFE